MPDSITRPAIVAFRSRAIVSVSGSSGIPLELAPRDVTPDLLAVERHTLGIFAGRGCSLFYCIGNAGNREHSAAIGYETIALAVARGSGMKYVHTARRRWKMDVIAFSNLLRISMRRKNMGDRAPARPSDLRAAQ
jgi:hypothetical protein